MTDTSAATPTPTLSYRPIDMRRAVLGHLIATAGPVSLDALVVVVTAAFGDRYSTPSGRKEVAEVVRHQVRYHRVRGVERGVYEYVPGAFSRSTEWRCRNWRAERIKLSGAG